MATVRSCAARGDAVRMPVDGVWGPIIRRFGVPPWRVALHILLLVLVTMQVLQRNTQMALYRRRSEAAWQGLLYPPWAADTPADPLSFPGNVFYLYTAEDVERTMVYMVEAFDQMSTVTIDRVDTKPPPHLIVSTDTETSAVAIDSVAALRNQFGNDTAAFVGSADTLTLAFALESVDVVAGVSSACVMWSVDVLFTIHLGSVTVAPVYGSQTCTSNSGWSSVSSLLIVEVAVSIVAAAHMFAMLLSWTRSARLMYVLYLLQKGYSRKDGKHRRGVTATGFASLSVSHGSATGRGGNGDGTTGGSASAHRESRRAVHALMSPSAIDLRSAKRVAFVAGTKTRVAAPQGLLLAIDDETAMSLSRAQLLASQLTFSDVLPVLQIVNGLLFIANATLIAHNVTSFTEGEASVSAGWALPLALAVAAVWATFLQYLKFSARYYMLIRTLNYGLPRIAQFLVGVAPIFISFCLFGMVVFGPRTFRFSNFSQTAITLFAVMNGDVMRETYLMVIGLQKGWFLRALSQLYLYAFVCLFIYVVLMACIAIMEEAFFFSRPDEVQIEDLITQQIMRKEKDNPGSTPSALPPRARRAPGGDEEWRYTLPRRLHLVLRELEPHQPHRQMRELVAFARRGLGGSGAAPAPASHRQAGRPRVSSQ